MSFTVHHRYAELGPSTSVELVAVLIDSMNIWAISSSVCPIVSSAHDRLSADRRLSVLLTVHSIIRLVGLSRVR